PTGTLFILSKITTKPAEEITIQIIEIIAIYLLMYLIIKPGNKIGSSGLIGIALLAYGAYSLAGFLWFLPILIAVILIAYTDIFISKPIKDADLYRIRSVFYILVIPLCWLLVANINASNKEIFFVPFLITILAHLSIIWQGRSREIKREKEAIKNAMIYHSPAWLRSFFLILFFLPMLLILDQRLSVLLTIICSYLGILVSDSIFWLIEDNVGQNWSFINLLRLRMGIVLLITLIILMVNLCFYNRAVV
ncbi:MAG: hypothetical protein AB1782_13585, partial [Cyanobacteriota bacterium]